MIFSDENHFQRRVSRHERGLKKNKIKKMTTTVSTTTVFATKGSERKDDDFFDVHLIECLGCGGVYRKLAPARYVREGHADEGPSRRRPCAKCGTGEHCVEWRGRRRRGGSRVERTAFPFAAGVVVAGGTRDARRA